MSANGAIRLAHRFTILGRRVAGDGVFLGIVMMPFYYGSKVRIVPMFLRRGSTLDSTFSTRSASSLARC